MIEVQFMKPTADRLGMTVAATLRVQDDGRHTFVGELTEAILETPILDRSHPGGHILFRDDPIAWARNCRKAFRTPYLVPRITRDSATSQ